MPHRPECRFSKAFSRSKQEHMTEKTTPREKLTEADYRKKRLAEQLRANLMRRKAQSRSRRAGEADERNDGITAGHGKEE
ncbi:hypothetical protein IB024_09080 [Brucella sp. 6810]|uniref:Transcriptional regulator n=1 Tax=Brucella inopinata TaxID=1218315 RepID=A0AAW7B6F7_9HYPH|nr:MULTISPECIES: hypothetical protein [Brucella]KEY03864.1 hypothetical protein IL59_0213870 [Brucella suis bv. 4 str. 40]MDL2333836.1 hypothetical protein [Brucella inopinata]MRN43000.1 hypothetical protein [Brucella sp. 09RB8913]MRN59056.1 hypothetical protein [Brucella sp. 09RB8918]QGA57277.1 hypothetical protein GHC20_09400 [Brucella sp. 2280]